MARVAILLSPTRLRGPLDLCPGSPMMSQPPEVKVLRCCLLPQRTQGGSGLEVRPHDQVQKWLPQPTARFFLGATQRMARSLTHVRCTTLKVLNIVVGLPLS